MSACMTNSMISILHLHCLKIIKKYTYFIVSEIINLSKDKSKLSVTAFILKLLEIIKFQANKRNLIIWSDSASSGFKNEFIYYFLF